MRKKRSDSPSNEVLKCIIEIMQDKKASEIVHLNLMKIQGAVTDHFVISHANSKTQVDAIASHIMEDLHKNIGVKPYHFEGFENSEWILIDYVDIVVHVFLNSARTFYQLEELWADAEIVRYDD